MELDLDGVHPEDLQGFLELNGPAVQLDSLLLQSLPDVRVGHGTEELVILADLYRDLNADMLQPVGQFLGFASLATDPGRLLSLGLPLILLAGLAQAQDEFADIEVTTTHVAGKVYMLKAAGGNIAVSVGEDGMLLVDDQFAPLAEKIQAALAELGEGKLAFVLNTHWHGDHTGGNAEFDKLAPIISHKNVRARLATPQELTRNTYEAQPEAALPIAQAASDGGDDLGFVDLKVYLYGLIKRTVV